MTKAVDPSKAINYMIKAESSLNIAKIAITQQAYDNAVMSAVHSAINAMDALTTFYLNKRSSGAHTDVLLLIKGIFSGQDYVNVSRQFNSLLSLKNASEYQPDLMGSDDAVNSVKWAERIINKVKDKLKK